MIGKINKKKIGQSDITKIAELLLKKKTSSDKTYYANFYSASNLYDLYLHSRLFISHSNECNRWGRKIFTFPE